MITTDAPIVTTATTTSITSLPNKVEVQGDDSWSSKIMVPTIDSSMPASMSTTAMGFGSASMEVATSGFESAFHASSGAGST